MKLVKLSTVGFGLIGLALSAQAAVKYVGVTSDSDVTTVISLNPLSVNGNSTFDHDNNSGTAQVTVTGATLTAAYGGTYSAASGTEPATWSWAAANTPVLQEIIFVRNGALSIEPGTIVRGQPDSGSFNPGALVIAAGAQILASGNPTSPIIFTTASTTAMTAPNLGATRASGATPTFWDSAPATAPKSPLIGSGWGGVIVLGNAPVNSDRDGAGEQDYFTVTASTAAITNGTGVTGNRSASNDDRFSVEGIPTLSNAFTGGHDRFGGFLSNENSGVLSYVSIRHGGANLTANNEINGLTLGAVGAGTTINNIEIWGNTDDGVEIFGGTVNLKNIAIFGVQDDGLDLDVGYAGTVQFLLVVAGANTDKLGEWDGSYQSETSINGLTYITGPAAVNRAPFANATIANATLIGNSSGAFSSGLHIRDQSSYRFVNSIVVNPTKLSTAGPIEIDNRAADSYSTTSNYAAGRAYFKGVTFSSATYNTAALLFDNGSSSNTVIRAEVVKAIYGNNMNDAVGFANVPTGGNLNADLEFDPKPTTITDGAVLDETTVGANASFTVVSYRGAFDANEATLWTADWTAADAYGLIVK